MAADTKLITLRWHGFSGALRGSWLLLKMLFVIWVGCTKALWRNGTVVNFSLTDQPNGPSVTVTVSKEKIALETKRHVTTM